MPRPLLCLDEEVRSVAECFRSVFSKPPDQSFVTVLLGMRECEGKRTLSGVVSKVGQSPSLSGLSRLFSEAPWVQEAVVVIWREQVRGEMPPLVAAAREQLHQGQPTCRGRPTQLCVTGKVMGDDWTLSQPKGRTMEGLGKHHATTSDQGIVDRRLLQGLSVPHVLWLRSCSDRPRSAKPKGYHSSARSR